MVNANLFCLSGINYYLFRISEDQTWHGDAKSVMTVKYDCQNAQLSKLMCPFALNFHC